MFEVGQYVVKANTGVCRVTEISLYQPTEEDEEKLYYYLTPYGDSKARLFVPVESSRSNIRCIMTAGEAMDLIHKIPEIAVAWIESDRLREQEYKDAIRSNSPERLVSVIKNLYLRSRKREKMGKKSTAVDDRYFHLAETALYSELAVALGKETAEIRQFISDTLGESGEEETVS